MRFATHVTGVILFCAAAMLFAGSAVAADEAKKENKPAAAKSNNAAGSHQDMMAQMAQLAKPGPQHARDGTRVRALSWKSSADLFTLAEANALLVRAENEPAREAGAVVRVIEL